MMPMPGLPIPMARAPLNFNMRKEAQPILPTKPVTVFVGNITDKCHDSVVQEVLGRCGPIFNWKRLQDSNGKLQKFGFCDFIYPDGARRALSVLKDYPLGDKRLNVKVFFNSWAINSNNFTTKVDEQTEKFLEEFTKAKQKMPGAIEAEETDDALREGIKKILEENAPELLELTVQEGCKKYWRSLI